jgi:hypothetical protein
MTFENTAPVSLLAAQRIAETGLTAAELLALSHDEYARITGRATISETVSQASGYQVSPPPAPQEQTPAPVRTRAPLTPGFDFASMDMEQYAAVRGQLGVGVSRKEGRGIFDSVGSRSDEYTNAVRAQAGRTAMSNANTVEPPRLTDRYVRQDDMRDHRTAAQRFSTPGNSYQGR